MEYYFNNLSPTSFQRLINGILVARYGDSVRLTPLRGKDGGRDAETAPGNPFSEYQVTIPQDHEGVIQKGRYLFQVKHHRTVDVRLQDARSTVISDFETELKNNVLNREGDERVNNFFLITNVPSSRDSIQSIDNKRRELLENHPNLHVDVWWQETVIAYLDQLPQLWTSAPEMFAGNKVPFLGEFVSGQSNPLSRAIRLALESQYRRDSIVKFRQIELQQSLTKLFVDLDVNISHLNYEDVMHLKAVAYGEEVDEESFFYENEIHYVPDYYRERFSALRVLLSENNKGTQKIILEGGPGQGKSTITQMLAQIYRNELLKKENLDPEGRWVAPSKLRLPIRFELRNFAEWLINNYEESLEQYISNIFSKDAGGNQITVDDIHKAVEGSPTILICDGLDEVGNDDLRNSVLSKIADCVDRLSDSLKCDLKVIVTTRPPAIAGRRDLLPEFTRIPLARLSKENIDNYLNRWLLVQALDGDEIESIRNSFESRRDETHVKALVKNPMQLSVLLHFIKYKGEAFPDRRAELYREYFKTVIDRDVEKSPQLRQQRETIEMLHQLLGYKIHSLSETEAADGTLKRGQLLDIVQEWLNCQGSKAKTADELFKLGEERFGLIVALRGEGEDARYGYEVQPIREYFAAAFINDQIKGNAHDVYQHMVPRSYWKEVALFLAGLRRPNEKADLISRAKVIDADLNDGWRQNGRSITLQLLLEGVLSHPKHVFNEALDFVIDIFDPSVIKAANQPKGMLHLIPKLINQGDERNRFKEKFLRIINNTNNINNLYVIFRLFRMMSQILENDEIAKELVDFKTTDPRIKEKVRIHFPYLWNVDMNKFTNEYQFWDDLSPNRVAAYWWEAALFNNLATSLNAPDLFHSKLVEQYAINSTSIFDQLSIEKISYKQPSNGWAIWKFVQYQQILALAVSSRKITDDLRTKYSIISPNDDDYIGLDGEMRDLLKQFNESLYNLLISLDKDRKVTIKALFAYINLIKHFLGIPGLLNWFACKTAINLLQIKYYQRSAWRTSRSNNIGLDDYWRNDVVKELWEQTQIFYSFKTPISTSSFERQINHIGYVRSGLYYREQQIKNPHPLKILINEKKQAINVIDVMYEHICNGTNLPYEWFGRISWSLNIVRPLIERCKDCLSDALRFLSNIQFNAYSLKVTSKPLKIQDIQKILKLVRNSDDSAIHLGALISLTHSNFLNVVTIEDLLEMIAAVSNKSRFATNLFNSAANPESKDVVPHAILIEVAKKIIENPDKFSDDVCRTVATFLADNSSISLPPLLTFEENLGLQAQHTTAI
ncbi:MAG TPA: hypothetical protein VF644_02835 [Pyrinomonadaceae bacterium]|jgi:hypothetical protein